MLHRQPQLKAQAARALEPSFDCSPTQLVTAGCLVMEGSSVRVYLLATCSIHSSLVSWLLDQPLKISDQRRAHTYTTFFVSACTHERSPVLLPCLCPLQRVAKRAYSGRQVIAGRSSFRSSHCRCSVLQGVGAHSTQTPRRRRFASARLPPPPPPPPLLPLPPPRPPACCNVAAALPSAY